MNKNLMNNENKGFSLVELIVVIAIMAVLTSVLAPSLLGYVEKSRMQKDDSAMGEVANAIQLALADQNVYDECLTYSVKGNYSCYVDSTLASATDKFAITIFDKCGAINEANHKHDSTNKNLPVAYTDATTPYDQWHYNDSVRLKDEEAYNPEGQMRGLTITFRTDGGSNTASFKLADAIINKIPNQKSGAKASKDGTAPSGALTATLSTMDADKTVTANQRAYLYNKVRAAIGDSVVLSSQTYRNSDYTVFIRMGSMGGNQASAQDAIAVYGQWNGTNLDPHES